MGLSCRLYQVRISPKVTVSRVCCRLGEDGGSAGAGDTPAGGAGRHRRQAERTRARPRLAGEGVSDTVVYVFGL